ncbi:unnamed protein product, partial [Gongylonema pulchrum]|uniref:Thioredoxin domain-containing protein n=1 Tax=Gongylonema pulchrum TaxID=637853 RepID=A0A183EAY7_9BILA
MPIWEHVGHALADRQSPVRVAKLDCTRYAGTASALNIRGYPTIIFFRHGKELVYEGERKKEAMVDFALKASGPVIGLIEDVRELSQPFFVFVEGKPEKTHTSELIDSYHDIAEKLFSSIRFYQAKRDAFPKAVSLPDNPAVLVFKDNDYLTYTNEGDDFTAESLNDWIYNERWPLIPLITSTNIKEVGRMRMLVLAVVNMIDRRNGTTQIGKFFSVVTDAAQTVRKDTYLSSYFQFGWLDGSEIANNIAMGTINQP